MTMEQLCRKCEEMNREFNTAARTMDGRELSAFRQRMMVKHDIGFENGWSFRLCRRISDVFIIETVQVWTQTKKGLFGTKKSDRKIILTLSTPAVPELILKCTASGGDFADSLRAGEKLRVSGELEVSVFLRAGDVQWQSAEFGKGTKVTAV